MRIAFWFALLVAVAVRAAEFPTPKLQFTNRVETFETIRGERFEGVFIESLAPGGLFWAATNNPLKSGRVQLADLSQATRERLGVPEHFVRIEELRVKELDRRKVRAAFAPYEAELAREQTKRDAEAAERRKSHSLMTPEKINEKYGRVINTELLGKLVLRTHLFKDYSVSVLWDGDRWLGEMLKPVPERKMDDLECEALVKAIAAEGEWEKKESSGVLWTHHSGNFVAFKSLSFVHDTLVVLNKDAESAFQEFHRSDAARKADGF